MDFDLTVGERHWLIDCAAKEKRMIAHLKSKKSPRLLCLSSALCAIVATAAAQSTLLTTFKSPTSSGADLFGAPIVPVGTNKVLISAQLDDTGATNAGAAYLFDLQGNLLCSFTNPTPALDDQFGNAACAVGNDRVIIACSHDDVSATDAGVAYLFDLQGHILNTFTNPAPAFNDRFGTSVACVDGDRVVISASRADLGATDSGVAYVFDLQGQLLSTIQNPAPGFGDHFGNLVVAAGSNRVVVAAVLDDTFGVNAGAAYVFDLQGSLQTTITNPNPFQIDGFGSAVALVGGDKLIFGDYHYSTGLSSRVGHAYLFNLQGNRLVDFLNPFPAQGDWFGISVADAGLDRVIIGANGDAPQRAGAAYLMDLAGNLLNTITNPAPVNLADFGEPVACIDPERFAIGAPHGYTADNIPGAAYLFKVALPSPRLNMSHSPTNTFLLSWPSIYAGFTLQENTDLTTPNWTPAAGTMSDDGTNCTAILLPEAGPRFFRLKK